MGDFENSYDQLYLYAFRAARRIVEDKNAASDVASETLARAYSRCRVVESHAEAWVIRVAVNLAVDTVRRRPAPLSPSSPAAGEPSLDRVVLAGQLARLPRRQRESLVLRYLLDLDEEQTAHILGVTIGTVHTHVTRGLARIRRQLPPDIAYGVEVP